MNDLRMRVVEAGAQAVRQLVFDILMHEFGMDDQDPDDQEWGTEQTDDWMEHWFATGAGKQLDAMLDVLAENADEWENEATMREILEYPDRNESEAGWLLAVLREDR